MIGGIAIAVIILVAILICCLTCFGKKKREKRKVEDIEIASAHTADPSPKPSSLPTRLEMPDQKPMLTKDNYASQSSVGNLSKPDLDETDVVMKK